MPCPGGKAAGLLFFAAVAQFILGLVIAEALYPSYSVSGNYVSDLGVGSSSIVFNSSVFVLGVLLAAGTYSLRRDPDLRMAAALLFIMALAAMGVGVFTEDFAVIHGAVSSLAFLFGGLSALASAKAVKTPLSIIGAALGAMTIGALALFSIGMITSGSLTGDVAYDSVFYLGLGPGGMERMIIYPALMWLAVFSGYLIAREK